MRQINLLLVLLVLLVFTGCTAVAPEVQYPPEVVPGITSGPEVGQPPVDRTWVSPAKVEVSGYYPGGRAEYPISIHNGKTTEARFLVSYRIPDNPWEGYEKAPVGAENWVTVNPEVVVPPRSTKDVLVILQVPKGVEISGKSWEFWVSVIEGGQGLLQTELCIRWLITMR